MNGFFDKLAAESYRTIDRHLALALLKALPEEVKTESVLVSIILLNQALEQGHSCLKLDAFAGHKWGQDDQHEGIELPTLTAWQQSLSPFAPAAQLPLVLEHDRLYLRRYWQFERSVSSKLSKMANTELPYNESVLVDVIAKLFPPSDPSSIDWQKLAVINSLHRGFSLIAGGPGTGKTTTVTKLLLALVAMRETLPEIKLVAPTGKAAQRLSESIIAAKAKLSDQLPAHWLDGIPSEASTLHRLLGVVPNHFKFRHHRENPLQVDILVIDEVSMVDLSLMAQLLSALPDECQLIFLGDHNQLPSVAAGSILTELSADQTSWSAENIRRLQPYSQYALDQWQENNERRAKDYLALLTYSHRFASGGGIGQVAQAVIEGDSEQSWQLLHNSGEQLQLKSQDLRAWVHQLVDQHYCALFEFSQVEDALQHLSTFRILAATRQGERGVESLNELVVTRLRSLGLSQGQMKSFHGCPIMVTENNYPLQLFNGDIGIYWEHEGRLQVAFTDASGKTRWLLPSRLPGHEVVFAMTIHKTQGSEFGQVAIVMPETKHRLLSRELLYTGITRAKQKLSVFAEQEIWQHTVEQKVCRWSGLNLTNDKVV